ncbi:glycosyltransferase [Candidatus Nitrospira bockiana]
MRVAIVHDWLTGMRGGERCLEALCELFPKAPIYTLLHVPGSVSAAIEEHQIVTSFVQSLPCVTSWYRYYLPIFPSAIERFNFDDFDVILSSSHCVAKGVRVPKGVCHISYIHTPMRYVWDQYDSYFGKGRCAFITRSVMSAVRVSLQKWDVASSSRVHYFVANSQHVADRVRRHYSRHSSVICPPVDYGAFAISDERQDYYLVVTAFAPYKRVDLAIEACNRLSRPLKIIGSGQDEQRLRALAGPTVEFLGWQPDEVLRRHYSRCKALLFPGQEDFGIVPLEAMASGRPVIAYGKGGALETVVAMNPVEPGVGGSGAAAPTGVFFYQQTTEAVCEAIQLFEKNERRFDPEAIRQHVARFDRACFKNRMHDFVHSSYEEFTRQREC